MCIQDAIFSDSYGEAIDLIYGDCLDFDEDIFGCVDSNACNYNQNATVDNGSVNIQMKILIVTAIV